MNTGVVGKLREYNETCGNEILLAATNTLTVTRPHPTIVKVKGWGFAPPMSNCCANKRSPKP